MEHWKSISDMENNCNISKNKDNEKPKFDSKMKQCKNPINNQAFSNYVQIININKYKVKITFSFQLNQGIIQN